MIIETKKLKSAINTIMPGIEAGKVTIEGADLVIFLGGKVMSYNGKAAVSMPLDIGGAEFGVNAKDLNALVSKLKEETLDIQIDDTKARAVVKSGKLKATLVMQDISVIRKYLDKIKFGTEKNLPENFVDGVKVVAIADNNTPLKGFAVGKINEKPYLMSTDKHRISAYELSSDIDQFLADDGLIEQALSLGKAHTYSIVGPWLHIGFEGGMHFSLLRNNDKVYPFPAIGNAMNIATTSEVLAEFSFPATLGEVVDRVTTLGDMDANNKLRCEIRITTTGMVVTASKNFGSAEEEIAWDKPLEISEEYSVRMPVKTLMGLAGKGASCKLINFGKVKALVITNNAYTLIASAK